MNTSKTLILQLRARADGHYGTAYQPDICLDREAAAHFVALDAVVEKLVVALKMRSCNRWFCGRMKQEETDTALHICERCTALAAVEELEEEMSPK